MAIRHRPHTVLIVEDDEALQHAIVVKLTTSGFNTLATKDVDGGIALLTGHPEIEAIWLDHYLLGKKNGLDYVAILKGDGSQWKKLPIFVVSNSSSPDKVHSYLRLGVAKYFVKAEYRLDEIIADLRAYLERRSKD